MTITDDEGELEARQALSRPWWFAPALVGIGLGALLGAVLVPAPVSTRPTALVSGRTYPVASLTSPTPTIPATRPADLPVLAQEDQVVAAMDRVYVVATAVGSSRYDRVLGPALPSRVFDLRGGTADVLFLDAPRDIHVCAAATPQGQLVYRISVDGRDTSSIDAAPPIAFLVSRELFVIAPDERAASMFQLAMDLGRAPC